MDLDPRQGLLAEGEVMCFRIDSQSPLLVSSALWLAWATLATTTAARLLMPHSSTKSVPRPQSSLRLLPTMPLLKPSHRLQRRLSSARLRAV